MKNIVHLSNNLSLVELSENENNIQITDKYDTKLAQTTYNLYEKLFSVIKEHNLGTPARIWNYVPHINKLCGAEIPDIDRERYRQFNKGRLDAFTKFAPRDANGTIIRPAATGVGSFEEEFRISCLVTTDKTINIENARQISSYKYPPIHGSSTPSFSRGTIMQTQDNEILYISGTASIINSQTMHKGDVEKQTEESLNNIDFLLSEENISKYGVKGFSLNNITSLKVYFRNVADYILIKNTIASKISQPIPIVYVNADICRRDLLVEIEGIVSRQQNKDA
jgi:chorismate lyase / 3-hydroxybenzoate synthase